MSSEERRGQEERLWNMDGCVSVIRMQKEAMAEISVAYPLSSQVA
jgi:hypothetical protein